jgi:hypothetical protein
METDDRQRVTAETLQERDLMSYNGMINTAQSKTRHAKTPARSKNDHSHAPVYLSPSTTKPTAIVKPDDQSVNTVVQEYDPPNVLRHPRSHRRVRMLNDLAKRECPLVQAGEGKAQKVYPEIRVTNYMIVLILKNNSLLKVPNPDGQELHIRVRAVTENKHPHPLQTVAPENALVNYKLMKDNNERICLQCDPDSFNPELGCVFLTITRDERRSRRKKYVDMGLYIYIICQCLRIKVHLFNWKQCAPAIKEVIKQENLRLCRLEFYLCIRLNPGEYQLVSQPSYTSVMEEGSAHFNFFLFFTVIFV